MKRYLPFFMICLLIFLTGNLNTQQKLTTAHLTDLGEYALQSDDLQAEDEIKPLNKSPLKIELGDSIFDFSARFRVESFYGKSINLLNADSNDQVLIPAKHTIDFSMGYGLGKPSRGYEVFKLKTTVRTRGTWGAPESIASTGPATLKLGEAVFGSHTHAINRFILWMRELWMDVSLEGIFNYPNVYNHKFTMGFFPFELGRGISLGSAYATDPDILGYTPMVGIDQFAPGFKLSGNLIVPNYLSYDLYAAILRNRSDTFNNVNLATQGQEFNSVGESRVCEPARGFGKIDYVVAGRLTWKPVDDREKKFHLEPYVLYDRQAEQRIEFIGDAESKLGTIGVALNSEYKGFIFDFECAKNMGRQNVKGWDRNAITIENRNGVLTVVNSEVTAIANQPPDDAGKKAISNSSNQDIINRSVRGEQYNGQQIVVATNGETNLQNTSQRFSNPYKNVYSGFMFVTDLGYRFSKNWRFAIELGYATGDANPNRDIHGLGDSNKDGNYRGFISLQEVYQGSLVKSAFLLNGSAKVPRVSNFASLDLSDPTANLITRFNNIIYVGPSVEIKGVFHEMPWTVMPNVITYWQEFPLKLFDRVDGLSSHKNARKWLGVEANMFGDIMLMQDFKLFFVGALFFPGSYYDDIKGKPINKDQQKAIERLNKTGSIGERTLFSSNHVAFFMNLGLEYRF